MKHEKNLSDEDPGRQISDSLKFAKTVARQTIERWKMASAAPSDSMERKGHEDILENDLKPLMLNILRVFYSLILSYNSDHKKWYPLTHKDIRKARREMKQIVARLRKAGFPVVFGQDFAAFDGVD